MINILLVAIELGDTNFHYFVYGVMTIIIIFLLTRKSYRPKAPIVLTPKEINELITTWEPKPLISSKPDPYYNFNIETIPIVERIEKNIIHLEGYKNLLNCATTNFLGFTQGSEYIEPESLKVLKQTGVGSCGPRNFYGTLDVHLDFEKEIAKFLHVESAILYSSTIATCASVIPTFAAREDIILSDMYVRKSIQLGNYNSRATVYYFRHNDVNHLEELMIKVTNELKKQGKKNIRRFVTVEGIYQNYGTICRLKEVIALAKQYKFRVILDDSFGLGCIGETGRGTLEYLGLKTSDVQIYCADVSNSIGALGGVCCGATEMTRVQRLNGSGYMYSASNPPYAVASGTVALQTINKNTDIVLELQEKAKLLHDLASSISQIEFNTFNLCPFIIFRLNENMRPQDKYEEIKLYQQIVDNVKSKGIAITRLKYTKAEKYPPPPQIRISIMVQHTNEQIKQIIDVLRTVLDEIL